MNHIVFFMLPLMFLTFTISSCGLPVKRVERENLLKEISTVCVITDTANNIKSIDPVLNDTAIKILKNEGINAVGPGCLPEDLRIMRSSLVGISTSTPQFVSPPINKACDATLAIYYDTFDMTFLDGFFSKPAIVKVIDDVKSLAEDKRLFTVRGRAGLYKNGKIIIFNLVYDDVIVTQGEWDKIKNTPNIEIIQKIYSIQDFQI